jgi:hypothetical protein
MFKFKGAVNVLEAAISRLLKEFVLAPVIVVVPSKVTVPELLLNVPALTQLPPTFIFAAGAVNVLDAAMSRLLKELVLAPLIVVVPSKVTVPPLAVKVPALTQLPPTFIFAAGAVSVLEAAISTLLKETVLLPLIIDVPSNVMVLLPALNVPPFKVKFPLSNKPPLPLMNVPPAWVHPLDPTVRVSDAL